MSVKVTADNLSKAIISAIEDYGDAVNGQLDGIVRKVATTCRKSIQENSPVKTGAYRTGWAVKYGQALPTSSSAIVYNKRVPGLAHLLENGHALVNGGRVEGKPHIAPAADRAADELVKRMKEAAKNG